MIAAVIIVTIILIGTCVAALAIAERRARKRREEHDQFLEEQHQRQIEGRQTRERLHRISGWGQTVERRGDHFQVHSNTLDPLSPLSPLWIGHSAPEASHHSVPDPCSPSHDSSPSMDSPSCDAGSTGGDSGSY
jgi:hypothetical protein